MTTTDRVEKVVRQWQQGYLTLPDLIEQLSEIDYLSTVVTETSQSLALSLSRRA